MTTVSTSPTDTKVGVQQWLPKLAALAGLSGPPVFALIILILTRAQDDFLRSLGWHLRQASTVPWPSALALGPYGWLQMANFILFGLLLTAFAGGLRRAIIPGRGAAIGAALQIVAGSALVLAAFPTEPDLSRLPQTLPGWIHFLAFLLLAGSLLPSYFFLWHQLRKDARWRGYDWLTFATGVLAVGSFFAPGPLAFYCFLTVILTWMEVMAIRLWQIAR